MRRYRFYLLLLFTLIIALLFASDFLTGRVYREEQDPYSRARRITQKRLGLPSQEVVTNAMSDYYYGALGQPRAYLWQPSPQSYTVDKISGTLHNDKAEIPPIMFLDPNIELEFLRALPTDAVRRAVIHALFQPRKPDSDPASPAWNSRQAAAEAERVKHIVTWYNVNRDKPSVLFSQWWRENAAYFGLKPDGTSLVTPVASAHDHKKER